MGSDDPITLAGLVFETASGLRRLAGHQYEHDHELPPQSFEVLIRLARSPGARLRMSDLAAQTSLTPSGLTRAIDRLEESGLAGRAACAEDRRGSFAELTPLGREKMEHVLGCHRARLEEVVGGCLAPEDRRVLVELLRQLRDHVNPGAARVTDGD